MSIRRTNPKKAVPALLKRIKNDLETKKDASSAEDIKKIDECINSLKDPRTAHKQWEEKLLNKFWELDRKYRKGSDFSSILADLTQINKYLLKLDAEAEKNLTDPTWQYKNSLPALSPLEQKIIEAAEADKNPMVKSLRMSYGMLDSLELRICLLFLAIFPENAILKKRLLIYWWIGEGLVRNEAEGEKIFKNLRELELIVPYRTDKRPRVSKCRIHPWIRYMLISEGKKQQLLHIKHEIPRFNPPQSLRACLIADSTSLAKEIGSQILETSLRTIFNVSGISLRGRPEWVAKLKGLAVLQLGRWQVSPIHHIEVQGEPFLRGLRTQKHLKYLSLRGISRITELPSSIGELDSLEILDLKACHNLEKLPGNIASLKKLTHLDVSECHFLESMPMGLDKLTSLQVLKGFIIGSSEKTPCRIEDLQNLKGLERLSIHIGNEADIQGNDFDGLKDLIKLRCLKISWGAVRKDEVLKENDHKEARTMSLSFPPSLEKLDLEGFPHGSMPEWLKPSKLRNLQKLYIKGGELQSLYVENDTEQWNVKILLLMYMIKLQNIDEKTARNMFPSLKYVKKVGWKEEGDTSKTSADVEKKEGDTSKTSVDFEWLSEGSWEGGISLSLP